MIDILELSEGETSIHEKANGGDSQDDNEEDDLLKLDAVSAKRQIVAEVSYSGYVIQKPQHLLQ